jgi:hypothetical protein
MTAKTPIPTHDGDELDEHNLETRLRQDLGLLEWQIRDLMPIVAAWHTKQLEAKVAEARLKELETLEARSDCIEDQCGLDAQLLRDNLLERIHELRAHLTPKDKPGGKEGEV